MRVLEHQDGRYYVREGVRLAYRDFGGAGMPVMLLHGLAGHAEEWTDTASWLTERAHVIALDARGHGRSDRRPRDLSHQARVDDVVFAIRELQIEPVVLVGQSVGGLTALSVAARTPSLVRGLVLIEASPSHGEDADAAAEAIDAALRQWPVPFQTREQAIAFFRDRFGSDLAALAWARGLEKTSNGLRPRFDIDVMVKTLREELSVATWSDWQQISSPTLIVRGERGTLAADATVEMKRRLPAAEIVEVRRAGHDVHLDQPEGFRRVLEGFLRQLP